MEQEDRAVTLLKAARDLLSKQKESPYVLDMLAETVHYDDADCSGDCLIDDINAYLEEVVEVDAQPEPVPAEGHVFFQDLSIGAKFKCGPSLTYQKVKKHTEKKNTLCVDLGTYTEFYAISQVRPISEE